MACGRKFSYPINPPKPRKTTGVTLTKDIFEMITDKITNKPTPVMKYTWRNENDFKIEMIDFGATVIGIKMPDKNGIIEDIVLGFPNFEQYSTKGMYYFGGTIGRVANRIANSAFTIRGKTFRLNANIPPHQLNGGVEGFDRALWTSCIENKRVVMSHHSPDNDEGYPGDVIVNAFFELTDDNEFVIEYRAYTTKPTWVNLTNHIYFNLAGHDGGSEELFNHLFTINGEYISNVNSLMIPNGFQTTIDKTPFDLRIPRTLQEIMSENPDVIGFDHNYCISKGEYQQDAFIARVDHPPSGRAIEIYSNQPTVQLYTGNKLPNSPDYHQGDPKKLDTLIGKKNTHYYKHGGFCLSPQFYPNAINHQDKFSKFILNPGDIYYNTCRFKFLVQK